MCVCACKFYLFTHLCQPETASCCPTLLLPWWTPFGLQQVHRCCCVDVFAHVCNLLETKVCVCACACSCMQCMLACQCPPRQGQMFVLQFVCIQLHCALVRVSVHNITTSLCFPRCTCPCDQVLTQMWVEGCDDSQRWWEEEVLVLFQSCWLSSRWLSPSPSLVSFHLSSNHFSFKHSLKYKILHHNQLQIDSVNYTSLNKQVVSWCATNPLCHQ